MTQEQYLKSFNACIVSMWQLIKHHHFALNGSENSWNTFYSACEDVIRSSPHEFHDILADWLLSYSKFRDAQINYSDPDSVPPYTIIGAKRFISLDNSAPVK